MNERIKTIADAATKLFLQQGYSKTQISHIAKAAGVSVGTIYLDFTGKKEIMHFILKCTIDPEFAGQELERPITDEQFAGIENEILGMKVSNPLFLAAGILGTTASSMKMVAKAGAGESCFCFGGTAEAGGLCGKAFAKAVQAD